MARILWGVTSTSGGIVKIFVNDETPAMAETDGVEIDLHPDALLDPLALDETLCHEFVHVLENHFAKDLKAPNPRGCTSLAVIFGRELPRMLRQLRQVAS